MRIILLSASARYLAESCLNAGHPFQAIDYFSDWDLQQLCEPRNQSECTAIQLKSSHELFRVASLDGWDAAVLGGGFENDLDLVRRLNHRVPVLGYATMAIGSLELAEYVHAVTSVIEQAGGSFPETRFQLPRVEPFGWLIKKLFGAGGQHVSVAKTDDLRHHLPAGYVCQRRIDGELVSTVFLAGNQGRWCQVIGSSTQLVGRAELGATTFAYCGSLAPKTFPHGTDIAQKIHAVGNALAEHFGFEGVFGIDFIVANQPTGSLVWVVDINPRIPASAELFERPNGRRSIVGLHVEACLGNELPRQPPVVVNQDQTLGKAILFCQNPDGVLIDQHKFDYLRLPLPVSRGAAGCRPLDHRRPSPRFANRLRTSRCQLVRAGCQRNVSKRLFDGMGRRDQAKDSFRQIELRPASRAPTSERKNPDRDAIRAWCFFRTQRKPATPVR